LLVALFFSWFASGGLTPAPADGGYADETKALFSIKM
jgi:hypothetical protein